MQRSCEPLVARSLGAQPAHHTVQAGTHLYMLAHLIMSLCSRTKPYSSTAVQRHMLVLLTRAAQPVGRSMLAEQCTAKALTVAYTLDIHTYYLLLAYFVL